MGFLSISVFIITPSFKRNKPISKIPLRFSFKNFRFFCEFCQFVKIFPFFSRDAIVYFSFLLTFSLKKI